MLAPPDPRRLGFSYRGATVAADTLVTLRQTDPLDVRVTPVTDLVLRRLEGVVPGLRYELPEAETVVRFPSGLDHLAFRSSSLTAFVRSAASVAGQLELAITGVNRRGQEAALHTLSAFGRGDPAAPTSLTIVPDTEDLTPFLDILPVTVRVAPTLTVGDGSAVERLAEAHWVALDSVNIRTGSWFRIVGETRIENSPDRRTIPGSVRRRIEKDFVRARITTTITSSVPLDARVRLHIARDPTRVYGRPEMVIPEHGAFEIIAAPRGAVEESQLEVALSREDMLFLASPGGVYSGTLVEFRPTVDDVRLHESDFVIVSTTAHMEVEVNR